MRCDCEHLANTPDYNISPTSQSTRHKMNGRTLRACCPNCRAGFLACRLRSFPTSRTKADSLTRNPGTEKTPEPADRNVCPTSEAEINLGNTPLTLQLCGITESGAPISESA